MKTLISWPVTVTTSDNTLRVTANAVTLDLSIPAGDYDGIAYSGVGMGVGATSLAQAFCTMLETHTQISSCTAVYDFTPASGTAHPATVYTLTYTHQAGDELEFSHANSTFQASTLGGVDGTDYTLASSMTNPQNSAGVWCPITGSDNTADIRDLEIPGAQSSAASATVAAGYSTRKLAEVYRGRLIYDVVDDAYIRAYRAESTQCAFPALAKRTIGDTQNTLERVLVAASENKTFTVLMDETIRFKCKIRSPWSIGDMTVQMGNSGAHYTVTIPHTVVT